MTLTLTPREIALAQGLDPDQAASPGTDAQDGTGGTDALQAAASGGQVADGQDAAGQDAAATASTDGQAVEQPVEQAEPHWHEQDDFRQWAAGYGISADELGQFGSEDEFRRFSLFLDRQLSAPAAGEGQPAQVARAAEQPASAPQSKQQQTAETAAATTGTTAADELPADLPFDDAELALLDPARYEKAGYDEETVRLAKITKIAAVALRQERAQRQKTEAEIAALRGEISQIKPAFDQFREAAVRQHQQAQLEVFHDLADGMNEDLFGRSLDGEGRVVRLPDDKDANRRKLFEAASTLAAGIVSRAQAAGKQPEMPPMKVLLARAEQLAFAGELSAAAAKKRAAELAAQSARRRPAAGSRQATVAAVHGEPDDPVASVANHPAVVEFWSRTQQENGAV